MPADVSSNYDRLLIRAADIDLDCNDKGVPLPHVANVLRVLAQDPTVAGMVGYNEFMEAVEIRRPPPPLNHGDRPFDGPYPRDLRRADVVAITAYIQRAHLARAAIMTVEDACYTEAFRNRFHPVREWLDGLQWDGTRRLDTWLIKTFGAPDTPYTRAVGAKTLIAAVRRIRQPGCKFDTMPVLEGGQGIGKSRCVRRLFGDDWFSDSMPSDLKSKDGMQAMLGVWCIEFAEIEHLIRTDTETMKAVLSRAVERFRSPYERGFAKRPRQCIFIGTTNATDYLRDPTGNRRIWPIACQHADEEWVQDNRDQLWAEAAMREAGREILWLEEDEREEAERHQVERMILDPWHHIIAEHVPGLGRVKAPDLLIRPLDVPKAQMNRAGENRVAAILKLLGWKPGRNKRERWWDEPEGDNP